MSDNPLRRAVQALLGQRPSATKRRDIAGQLRALAEEQEQLAGAEARNAARGGALVPRTAKGGRPRGTGARFLRLEAPREGSTRQLHVGRALWQELGEPHRLDPQRLGRTLILRPALGEDGYAVSRPKDGMPRMSIGESALEILGLVEGRYAARIEAGAIVADLD